MYRQGDLLFVRSEIPADAMEQKDGVLAKVEVTGHQHRIASRVQAIMMVSGIQAYVRSLHDADIVHEEHGTITLPIGDWKVCRQREYTPDGWRQVAD